MTAPVGAGGGIWRRDVTLRPFARGRGVNVLKPSLRITVETLLRNGRSQREIERQTGVDRKTIRRYGQALQEEPRADSPGVATGSEGRESGVLGEQNPPPRPPARPPKQARSACEEQREWIEQQVQLGRNAQSIYQDLVETCGFTHRYNSVKRFVRTLNGPAIGRARNSRLPRSGLVQTRLCAYEHRRVNSMLVQNLNLHCLLLGQHIGGSKSCHTRPGGSLLLRRGGSVLLRR